MIIYKAKSLFKLGFSTLNAGITSRIWDLANYYRFEVAFDNLTLEEGYCHKTSRWTLERLKLQDIASYKFKIKK